MHFFLSFLSEVGFLPFVMLEKVFVNNPLVVLQCVEPAFVLVHAFFFLFGLFISCLFCCVHVVSLEVEALVLHFG